MGIARECALCGKKFTAKRSRRKYCSLDCSATGAAKHRDQTGSRNPRWKGGTTEKRKAKYRIAHPTKHAAHMAVLNAVKRGDLQRGVCEVCGSSSVEGHHDDYDKPLVVRWLCSKHHREHHRNERLGQHGGYVSALRRG